MGANIVVDALWGDSGKGKVAAYLTKRENAGLCARAGIGTNAGHSIYLSQDDVIRTRQLPLGFLHDSAIIGVGSGVVVNPAIFHAEVERYKLQDRVRVDYRCAIVTEAHIRREQENAHLSEKVGTTASGSGMARADFILRRAQQAKEIDSLKPYLADVAELVNEEARTSQVIVECSQGTFLSLALSPDYPYVTSDNCTVTAAADDVGLSWQHITGATMVVKAVPSRVGAGPMPGELSREEIEKRGLAEYGVVTGRPRRKSAEIPWDMLRYAAMLNSPTEIALTFCDHYDPHVTGATEASDLTAAVRALIEKVEDVTNAPVTIVETGKLFAHMIDMRQSSA